MGIETALIASTIGLGAFSAVTQLDAGKQQSKAIQKQAEFNAQVYEQQGQMVLEQKRIQNEQYLRQRKSVQGKIIAGSAGKGFLFSGSPLAVLVDTETQLGFDKAIEDYNLDVKRNYALSGANYYRETGKQQSALARSSAYSNAFSTVLNTGFLASKL